MSRARQIADFGDGIATADIDDGAVTAAKIGSLPAGSVLQVVQSEASTLVISSTSSDTDTGLSASITPSSASNKILVLVNQSGCRSDGSGRRLELKLKRGSTSIAKFESSAAFSNDTSILVIGACSTSVLDSPNTTSSVTYKTTFASADNNASVSVQDGGNQTSPTSTIVLMEIAG